MSPDSQFEPNGSLTGEYAERLKRHSSTRWKRVLNVQAPYAWNLRKLSPGRMLDLGCGIGRNIAHVHGNGVGVDLNPECVAEARARGFQAYLPDEFRSVHADRSSTFDSLLVAHVLEHMPLAAGFDLVSEYLPFLRAGGQIIFITPQEAGFRSDSTHVEFINSSKLHALAQRLNLTVTRDFSFPFPRPLGRIFIHNEFVVTARKSSV